MAYAKTALLLAAMTALFLVAGFAIGGEGGAIAALAVAAAMNLWVWWGSDRAVLRLHGAREVDAASAPELVAIVAHLAGRAGLPMPKVYLIDTDQPNAFATGRNPENAAVAATTGLLRALSREELAGVMAHELAHIRNRDTLIMTVTATFAGAISMLANFAFLFGGSRDRPMGLAGTIALAILAPLGAVIVQMAVSRTREYAADRAGAEICGRPLWLADALGRIDTLARRIDNPAAERAPATAHMFIVNPLHAHAHDRLFATHPATANRIAALRALAGASETAPTGPARPRPDRGPWGGSGTRRG